MVEDTGNKHEYIDHIESKPCPKCKSSPEQRLLEALLGNRH